MKKNIKTDPETQALEDVVCLVFLEYYFDAFIEKHDEVDPNILNRESIGSLANCLACHINAEKGIYDEDDVKIPN